MCNNNCYISCCFFEPAGIFQGIGKTLISDATNQAKAYMAKGSNWAMSKIYPKISGEVQKRGGMIKNEVNQEKQKVSENIGKKLEIIFLELQIVLYIREFRKIASLQLNSIRSIS